MIVETLQPLVTPLKPRVVNVRVVKVVFVVKGFYRFCEDSIVLRVVHGCLLVGGILLTLVLKEPDCQKFWKLLQ